MPIVIDASALVEVVARTDRAAHVERAFAGHQLLAPDLINAEVLSVLRRWLHRSLIDRETAARAVRNLLMAPVRRFTTESLISTMWTLGDDLTPYTAAYTALARWVGCPLLTLDERLVRSSDLEIALLSV
ncbi:MAG: type II toxin-antitoxin system VapC family toxin [Egibacteraceae bacterium]